jgi:DNA transformation protein and related proteins
MPKDPRRFDDLFSAFGAIQLRRLFGVAGVFAGETMIGLVVEDLIYLKTDEATRGPYLAEGCEPFTYEKRKSGEQVVMSYYAVPDRLYDDPEAFAEWARAAQAVAERSPTAVKKRRKIAGRRVRG